MEQLPYTILSKEDFTNHPLFARLLSLHDVPEKIYIEGTLPEVTVDDYGRISPRILTVVGSRKNTTYGRQALEKLITSLKGEPVIVLSGLALGIDGLAHKSALENNITTIAVPGSGLSRKVLYPSIHTGLAEKIITYHGCLLSELDPETSAAPWTFPKRNRIMAALSDALLIVEAEEKSGTLITARLALELGKDIGAVPGEIFSPSSYGTNMLIKEGAYLISSKNDLMDLLHLREKSHTTISDEGIENDLSLLGDHEALLLSLVREPLHKDALLGKSGLTLPQFMTAFSTLEINGYLEESFGEIRRIV